MNRSILIPRRKCKTTSYLMRMARSIASSAIGLYRCICNYRYYRKQGICRSISWAQARGTL